MADINKLSNAQLIVKSGVPLDKIDFSKLSEDDLRELAGLKPLGFMDKAKRFVSNALQPEDAENQDATTGSGVSTPVEQPAEIVGGAPATPEESRYLMGGPTRQPSVRPPYKGPTQIRKPTEDEAHEFADDPTLIQQFFQNMPGIAEAVGMSPEQITERRRKFDAAKSAIELSGGRTEPQVYDQFVKGLVNEALLGLPQAIEKARGEEFAPEPSGSGEQIAKGAGNLVGFIVGAPGKFTKTVLGKAYDVLPALKLTGAEGILKQTGKLATAEAIGLGAGTGAAATGEALSQTDPGSALKVTIQAIEGGAITGATFGGTKGLVPGNAPFEKIMRIAVGTAALDTMRGRTPIDERELNQKIFDYGLDAYFLWKGIPRSKLNAFERDIMSDYDKAKADFDAGMKSSQEEAAGSPKPENAALQTTEQGGPTNDKTAGSERVRGAVPGRREEAGNVQEQGAGAEKAAPSGVLEETKKQIEKLPLLQIENRQPEKPTEAPPTEKPKTQGRITAEERPAELPPPPERITGTPNVGPDYGGASIADKSKFPVYRVPVDQIKADPKAFQFKLDVNQAGEQVPLKGEWNDLASGNLLLWQAKDGTLYVANGHHRLAHAQRTGQKEVNAQVLREEDGYTIRDARNLAAESNILEGKGTVYDHAEYFRTMQGYDEGMAAKRGIKGKGFAIGRDATDNTYWLFKAKDITPEAAETIAKTAPNDENLQGVGSRYAVDHPKADPAEIANFMRAMTFEKQAGAGGQEDLFGYDDTAIKDAEAQARTVARIIKGLKEEKAAISLAKSDKKIEIAQKHGIDIGDKEAVRGRITAIDQEIDSWEKWYINPELVKIVREKAGLAPKGEPEPQEEPEPRQAQHEDSAPLFSKKPKAKPEESEELPGFGKKDTFNLTGEGAGTVHKGPMPEKGPKQKSGDLFADRGGYAQKSSEKTPEERAEYSGRKRHPRRDTRTCGHGEGIARGKIPQAEGHHRARPEHPGRFLSAREVQPRRIAAQVICRSRSCGARSRPRNRPCRGLLPRHGKGTREHPGTYRQHEEIRRAAA